MPDFHVAFRNLLHTVNLRHDTDGFTSPPKEGVLRNFSAGFEPSNLGTKGQHATSRPPKPLISWLKNINLSSQFQLSSLNHPIIILVQHKLLLTEFFLFLSLISCLRSRNFAQLIVFVFDSPNKTCSSLLL